jgi:ubiquinone/menaquinone biosynthesis C-methylase UbiE
MKTNIDYWEKVLENPTDSFKAMFGAQKAYLKAHIKPNSKVLEIGCGNGRNLSSILDITENLVGIDNDHKAIKDARKNLKKFPNIQVILSEAIKLPFPKKTFDYIILLDILQNLGSDKIKLLSEAKRVLKDGASMIVGVYSESSLEERMKIYERIKVPIKKVERTKIVFDESVGANESEQFSQEQLKNMANEAGLNMVDCEEVKGIAHICTFIPK